jgi:hypothetical protein
VKNAADHSAKLPAIAFGPKGEVTDIPSTPNPAKEPFSGNPSKHLDARSRGLIRKAHGAVVEIWQRICCQSQAPRYTMVLLELPTETVV